MAEWVCPEWECHWKVNAPVARPVHAVALTGQPQAKDPSCPLHGTTMKYVPSPEEKRAAVADAKKVEAHPGHTISGELLTPYDIKKSPKKRAEMAELMGIKDKGHAKHGANFDSTQTLQQIINNLFTKTEGNVRKKAAEAIKQAFGYDPESKMMVAA